MLGAFAVGKTSLVRRFVHEVFDDRYKTTLGVKIDTKVVSKPAEDVKLIVWDMEGVDQADRSAELVNSKLKAYLNGVHGVLLVADGTRSSTIEVARRLKAWVQVACPGVPVLLMLNKADLADQWVAGQAGWESWLAGSHCFETSALSGQNVDRVFGQLAELLTAVR